MSRVIFLKGDSLVLCLVLAQSFRSPLPFPLTHHEDRGVVGRMDSSTGEDRVDVVCFCCCCFSMAVEVENSIERCFSSFSFHRFTARGDAFCSILEALQSTTPSHFHTFASRLRQRALGPQE